MSNLTITQSQFIVNILSNLVFPVLCAALGGGIFITFLEYFVARATHSLHPLEKYSLSKKRFAFFLITGFLLTLTYLPSILYNEQLRQRRIESGYEIYIDGQLVDINNIDIDQYQYSFNDTTKKMFLTHK